MLRGVQKRTRFFKQPRLKPWQRPELRRRHPDAARGSVGRKSKEPAASTWNRLCGSSLCALNRFGLETRLLL